jgi:hypothetical protein
MWLIPLKAHAGESENLGVSLLFAVFIAEQKKFSENSRNGTHQLIRGLLACDRGQLHPLLA